MRPCILSNNENMLNLKIVVFLHLFLYEQIVVLFAPIIIVKKIKIIICIFSKQLAESNVIVLCISTVFLQFRDIFSFPI